MEIDIQYIEANNFINEIKKAIKNILLNFPIAKNT